MRIRYPGKRLLFADVDNDGKTELVEGGMEWAASRGAKFPLTLRDQRGKEVWSYDASKWGEQHGTYASNLMLWAETVTGDLDGAGSTDVLVPGGHKPALLASALNLARGAPPYLAVAKRSEENCTLYLCGPHGARVFDEEPGDCLALSAIPSGPGAERLLLAGGDTVWQYRVAPQ